MNETIGGKIHFIDGSSIDLPKSVSKELQNRFRANVAPNAIFNFDDLTIMVQTIKYIEWYK